MFVFFVVIEFECFEVWVFILGFFVMVLIGFFVYVIFVVKC